MEVKYHIRKTWKDKKSQVGIDYNFLVNAQKACDKLEGYKVFDSYGNQVYPIIKEEKSMFVRGDSVQIVENALYINGEPVQEVYNGVKLVIKSVDANGYVLGRGVDAPPIGVPVKFEHVIPYNEIHAAEIDPYYISMTHDTNLYLAPEFDAKVLKVAPHMSLYKIVKEHSGWGKIEVGPGWVYLGDVMIIKKNEK